MRSLTPVLLLLMALGFFTTHACPYIGPSACQDQPEMQLMLSVKGRRCTTVTPDGDGLRLTWKWCEHHQYGDWVLPSHVTELIVSDDHQISSMNRPVLVLLSDLKQSTRSVHEFPSADEILTTKDLMLTWVVKCGTRHIDCDLVGNCTNGYHKLGKYECMNRCMIR